MPHPHNSTIITSNNTLYYNFKANITTNPNNKVIVHYAKIEAIASCKGSDFGLVSLAPFDQQGHNKNTTFPQVVFEWHSVRNFIIPN